MEPVIEQRQCKCSFLYSINLVCHNINRKFLHGWTPTNEFDWNVDYRIAYFILDDISGTDLQGPIIIRETNSKISVWQVTTAFLS